MSNSSPFKNSLWLWPEGAEFYLNNCHAQFRHDFELSALPEKAPLYITADQMYRLYVNGKYICRGPARGYQESWPYDEVDVREYLRCGHNWIAVEAYNPGIGTFQYIHEDAAGMICSADWGEVKINTCKKDWQMRRAPGNNPNVARLTRQMGFQEDFDAGKDDLSWIYDEEPPYWPEKEMFRWFGEYGHPYWPWMGLEERGIPMLREEEIAPEKIVAYGHGKMEEGCRQAFNIAWQWEEAERLSVQDWHEKAEPYPVRIEGSKMAFTVSPQADGEFMALVLRLEKIQLGSLGLEVTGGTGNEILDALYYQYLPDDKPVDLPPVGYGGMVALATRLRVGKDYCRRTGFMPYGARYIVLVCRDVTTTLTVKATWRKAEYPFTMRGRCHTSDETLNAVWQLCRHTQQICSADAYMDTPWREQGQWWGDARVQCRNTFFIDGDPRLLKRGIRSIAGQKSCFPLPPGLAPCYAKQLILPDFALTWVLTIYDYYWQTDDLELFREQLPTVEKVLGYFHSSEARDANGLLKFDPRFWLFEDWAPLPKEGYPTFLNLWYAYALKFVAVLFQAAGDAKRAQQVEKEREELLQLITAKFFDPAQQLFTSGLKSDGVTRCDEPPSLHDQALAILNDLQPQAYKKMVESRILPFVQGKECDFATPTSFWCCYLFEAMGKVGLAKEALEFIRSHWSKMLPSGGTWEHLVWNRYDGQSCCHAWSAHPAFHIPEILTGIQQLEPAWRKIRLRPNPQLMPQSGEVMIPSPQGDITITWDEPGKIRVKAPDTVTVIMD